MSRRIRPRERGAALVIVLLLVATLAFVLLSISEIMTAGVRRASAERARADLLWRAAAAEEVADQMLKSYLATKPAKMSAEDGVFSDQLELPFEDGTGVVVFADATGCFNLNSLVANGQEDPAESAKFVHLLNLVGLGPSEAEALKSVVVDFIDTDPAPQPDGAEDSFYTALPTPFRTAEGSIASVSELRAMDGVTREVYQRIAPYLCALPDPGPTKINVNMVSENHAPLIAAQLSGGAAPVSVDDVKKAIGSRPPGGWSNIADVPPELQPPGFSLTSNLVEARIRLEVNEATIEEALLFELKPDDVELLARTFGGAF